MAEETPHASDVSEIQEEEEEGEEETSLKSSKKRKERKDEAKEREKQIRLLQMYLESMIYKMPEKQLKASPQTEKLAKPYNVRYVGTHEEYGHVLSPKGRAKRIERKAKDISVITTEQLQEHMKQRVELDTRKKEARKKRERILKTILTKLEKQCHEQVISEIVEKFATYMSNKCANYIPPPVMTESAQRLTRGLVCNMYLSLGINQRPCNIDQSLFETVGLVLSDMILQVLFETQHYRENSSKSQCYMPPSTEEKASPKCIKKKEKKSSKKRSKKGKASYKKRKPFKISILPKEIRDYMRLSTKKCIECTPADDN